LPVSAVLLAEVPSFLLPKVTVETPRIVGEKTQGIGDGLHFILALGLVVRDATGVNQPLLAKGYQPLSSGD
jgi:hypothetical protein